MKYIFSIIVLSIFYSIAAAQFKSVGLTVGGGYTIINVQSVNDPMVLSDWDNLGLVFKGFGEYQISEGKLLGLEIGRNRLYYWQYPVSSYYNWRTEWTTNAVAYFSKYLGERFFLQSGVGIHFFSNGAVFGLLASAGTSFQAGPSISIPITFRVEPIFGSGTPVALNLATGIRFNLMK